MASYQRVALYVMFDAIERDLVDRARSIVLPGTQSLLTPDERAKAMARLERRDAPSIADLSDFDALTGLDLGDKVAVLMRHKAQLDEGTRTYYLGIRNGLERSIPVRNAVMHGRPLTTEEYAAGFSLANDLLTAAAYWPRLLVAYQNYNNDPAAFVSSSISLLDSEPSGETLNNLPTPDYDDTGFFPRPSLEKDLKKKLLGRHPVITVLGEGGDGKSALALQTLYGLATSNDHDFDVIVWVSAKSSKLSVNEITRIEGAITSSLGIFEAVADLLQPGDDSPIQRTIKLLEDNKVLLVIDNLETVLDDKIQEFAAEIPGASKLLLTSRVPLGSDLQVKVGPFEPDEALGFVKRLIDAYDIDALRKMRSATLRDHIKRLRFKPLWLKWFALGVLSGLNAERITSNPDIALKFCMENVFERLDGSAKYVLTVLSSVPSPLSPGIIQYITNEDSRVVEKSVAELLRFALIERVSLQTNEILFQVKPVARAYLSKVMKAAVPDMPQIIARFRSIEGSYQEERGRATTNRYDYRSFVVRSRSESIVARRLRHAFSLASRERFEEALEIIDTAKITDPDYFEIPRIEAYIAYRSGDVTRANAAYETALELGDDQPQLHAFYAGFLMRAFDDFSGAEKEFLRALELDPDGSYLLREAARNYFFLYKFAEAQDLLDKAWRLGSDYFRDALILNDLQVQLFIRHADHAHTMGMHKISSMALNKLYEYLRRAEAVYFDSTFLEHLRKALTIIASVRRAPAFVDHYMLDHLEESVREILLTNPLKPNQIPIDLFERSTELKTGTLKVAGRRENFGFIVDAWKGETFVSRSEVDPHVWVDMCKGRAVTFATRVDKIGRPVASNVTLL